MILPGILVEPQAFAMQQHLDFRNLPGEQEQEYQLLQTWLVQSIAGPPGVPFTNDRYEFRVTIIQWNYVQLFIESHFFNPVNLASVHPAAGCGVSG